MEYKKTTCCSVYIKSYLILAQEILFRNRNKENDDEMVKNPSLRKSMEKFQRRWTEESVVAG